MTRSNKKNKNKSNNQKQNSQGLLISNYKSEIIDKVKNNQVVLIVGQTGCGKSTQVPQYIHENRDIIGLRPESLISCLHPRSVAAITLGKRVAKENGTRVGKAVGFRVRFYSVFSNETRIVYMTTGFMVRLLSNPAMIENYSVVIVDEAHERSVQNDIIMGQMKLFMSKYKKLHLVVMSATMNIAEIQKYYPGAAMVQISPVNDHVEIFYRPVKGSDYVACVRDVVLEILRTTNRGHILVFMPSEDKVWRCKGMLFDAKAKVLPFYGAMDYEDKMAVFEDYNRRKVVVATNIAETSLTIDGVMFVVDSGYVKRVCYDYENRVEKWITDRVSVAEAEQRKGRAGRTGDRIGTCYRLYEDFTYEEKVKKHLGPFLPNLEKAYSFAQLQVIRDNIASITDIENGFIAVRNQIDELLAKTEPKKGAVTLRYPVPEIVITNLESTMLMMAATKLDIKTFPFIVAPSKESVEGAVAHLKTLSLLEDNGPLTPLGLRVAQLPLDPALGKVAVMASNLICREDVFIIISLLSSSSLLKRPSQNSHTVHKTFGHEDGDLAMLLNIWYEAEVNGFCPSWCKANGIIFSSLKFAKLIFNQLRWHLKFQSSHKFTRNLYPIEQRIYETKRAFLCGFFENLAVSVGKGRYQSTDDKIGIIYQYSCVPKTQMYVMPLSNHSSLSPKQVIMKQCTVYDYQLLMDLDPHHWRIRANLWREIIKFVTKSPKTSQ